MPSNFLVLKGPAALRYELITAEPISLYTHSITDSITISSTLLVYAGPKSQNAHVLLTKEPLHAWVLVKIIVEVDAIEMLL